MPSCNANTIKELEETEVGKTLTDYDQWLRSNSEAHWRSYDVVLIQGTDYFVEQIRKAFDGNSDLHVFGVIPSHARKGAKTSLWEQADSLVKTVELHHRQAGGVTSGRWRILGHRRLTGLKSSPVKRLLHHVVDPTEFGLELEGKNIPKGYVKCDERIPSSQRHVQVAVPCCFTKNKNVLVGRELSDKEMMVAYDLEESAQRSLRRYAEKSGETLTRDFVMEAPVKVLYRALGLVIKAVGCDVKSSSDVVKEPVTPPEMCNGLSTTTEEVKSDKTQHQLSGSTSKATPPSSPEVASTQASEQRSQVATKNDDAPVETTDWDVWTVDNYEPPSSFAKLEPGNCSGRKCGQAMVCIRGTFCHEKHGRLFDALRALMLRRARRNAFLGLVRYLRQTHGAKLVECVVRYRKKRKRGSRARKRKKRSVASNSMLLSRDEARLRAFGPSNERVFQVPSWTQRNRYRFRARKRVSSEANSHLELYKDVVVGSDALGRLANSSWWGWDHGSTLLFWRWPSRYRKAVRDGTKLFVKREKLPHFFRRQMWPSDPAHRRKMAEKIGKVRQRGYILPGKVNSLTGFFAVPKGDDDIRIVYDATACGLNDALWSPNFALPTIDSVLRNVEPTSWFSDIDLGEMF